MGRRRGGGEGAFSASESPLAPRAADGGAVPSARRRAASSAARSCCSSLEPRGGFVKRRGSQAATHPSYGSPYASPYCSFSLSPPPLPRQLTPFPDHAATRTRARGTPHAARVLVEARVAGGVSAGDAQRAQRTGEVVRHVGEGEEREHQDGGLPGPEAGPRAHQRPRGGGQAGGVEWLRCSTRRRKRRGGREERKGEGARRVQLVRRDGRDVSTLYRREGGSLDRWRRELVPQQRRRARLDPRHLSPPRQRRGHARVPPARDASGTARASRSALAARVLRDVSS